MVFIKYNRVSIALPSIARSVLPLKVIGSQNYVQGQSNPDLVLTFIVSSSYFFTHYLRLFLGFKSSTPSNKKLSTQYSPFKNSSQTFTFKHSRYFAISYPLLTKGGLTEPKLKFQYPLNCMELACQFLNK